MYLLTEDIGLKKKKNCVNLELGAARLLSRQVNLPKVPHRHSLSSQGGFF